jgi:hypothetical protein
MIKHNKILISKNNNYRRWQQSSRTSAIIFRPLIIAKCMSNSSC